MVNPVAGIGGPVGLKGSDGAELQAQARSRGGTLRAAQRFSQCLAHLAERIEPRQVHWWTWSGPMGADLLTGWPHAVLGTGPMPSAASDTVQAAQHIARAGVDCLVFVGGDGTARDLLAAVGDEVVVLGVPAGVKMHSGVFAVTPRAAAEVLARLVQGGLVASTEAAVRDFDGSAAAADVMPVKTYGELRVPEAAGFIQHTKEGGRESEPLAVEEICADVLERFPGSETLVLGAGSTLQAVKRALGFEGTLRGVDVLCADGTVRLDLAARDLEALAGPVHLMVSFSRGQGILFGRGNQQLSAGFLNALQWPGQVDIVATRTKLLSLEGRPLRVDTGDEALDAAMCGLVEVVAGYRDRLLYRIAPAGA